MIPRVLIDPPWLKQTAPPSLKAANPPSRVEAPDKVRQGWLARLPTPPRPPSEGTDDAILDRILDAVDRGQPFKEAELAALTDSGLQELLTEAAAKLTVRGAQYVLARLGERAVAPLATAAVRGWPASRGWPTSPLAPVLEHLFAPPLARVMARGLADDERDWPPVAQMREEPFVPSRCEAWLRQFGPDAAMSLLPVALDPEADGAAAARAALTHLALAGLPVADAARSLGAAEEQVPPWLRFEPVPAPPGSGLSWLPSLIAAGEAALVEALVADVEAPELARNLARWRDADASSEVQRVTDGWLRNHRRLAEEALTHSSYRPPQQPAPEDMLHVPSYREAMPTWWDLEALPRPRLVDGSPLPDSAVEHLATILRNTSVRTPYRGLADVVEACDPDSLDDFALALLEEFERHGHDGWCMRAAALVGGLRTFHRFGALIPQWAGEADPYLDAGEEFSSATAMEKRRPMQLANEATYTLIARGSVEVLQVLNAIRSFPNHANHLAHEALETHAKERGSVAWPPTLARCPVSSFGLDDDASRTFALFDSRVCVSFKEPSRPRLTLGGDEIASFPTGPTGPDGAPTDEVTRGSGKLDAEADRYARLASAVDTLRADVTETLDQDMAAGERWELEVFRAKLLEQALLAPLARQLVFGSFAEGRLEHSFRVSDRGGFLDVADQAVTLSPEARVGLLHPMELSDLARWQERFEALRLSQPVEQLGRPVFDPPACSETAFVPLPDETVVASSRCLALLRRRWQPTFRQIMTAEGIQWLERPRDAWSDGLRVFVKSFRGNALAWIAVEPGFERETPGAHPAQRVVGVHVPGGLSALDPIAMSELLLDLDLLRRAP